jgi:Choline/Carnitine o-acyltransferase
MSLHTLDVFENSAYESKMFSLVYLLLCTQVYESASTNRFHHGRTETIRTATSESLALARLLSVCVQVLL